MIRPNHDEDEPSLLFAYGTLKPLSAEAVAAGCWIPDAIRGRLYDLGPYPAVVDLDADDACWVEGFARPVDREELIHILDPYEAVDEGLFARTVTRTRQGRLVWIYVLARPLPGHARGPLASWAPARSDFVPDLAGRPYSNSSKPV